MRVNSSTRTIKGRVIWHFLATRSFSMASYGEMLDEYVRLDGSAEKRARVRENLLMKGDAMAWIEILRRNSDADAAEQSAVKSVGEALFLGEDGGLADGIGGDRFYREGVEMLLRSGSEQFSALGCKLLAACVASGRVEDLDGALKAACDLLQGETGRSASFAAESLARCAGLGALDAVCAALRGIDVGKGSVESVRLADVASRIAGASEDGFVAVHAAGLLEDLLESASRASSDPLAAMAMLELLPRLAGHSSGRRVLGWDGEKVVDESVLAALIALSNPGSEEEADVDASILAPGAVQSLFACIAAAARGERAELASAISEGMLRTVKVDEIEDAGFVDALATPELAATVALLERNEGFEALGALSSACESSPTLVRLVIASPPTTRAWNYICHHEDGGIAAMGARTIADAIAGGLGPDPKSTLPASFFHDAEEEGGGGGGEGEGGEDEDGASASAAAPSLSSPSSPSSSSPPPSATRSVRSVVSVANGLRAWEAGDAYERLWGVLGDGVLARVVRLLRTPDAATRMHCYTLFAALAGQPSGWGLRALAATPGVVAKILDRSRPELSAELSRARFAVALSALRCPVVASVEGWGRALHVKLLEARERGPYAVDKDEGEGGGE